VIYVGTETAVYAKDSAVDDGGEGEVVEDLAAVSPDVRRPILAHALVVKAIDLGYLSAILTSSIRLRAHVEEVLAHLLSWFPLIKPTRSGHRTLSARSNRNVSTLKNPRSTKSPIKR